MRSILKKLGDAKGDISQVGLEDIGGGKDIEDLGRRLDNALVAYTDDEARQVVDATDGDGFKQWQTLPEL